VFYSTSHVIEAHEWWQQSLEMFDELAEPHTTQIRVGFEIDPEDNESLFDS
jgi:hypothetical protein